MGKTFNARRLLIVGDMERGRYISDLMEQQLSWGHVIVGRLSIGDENGEKTDQTLGTLKDLPKILIDRPIDEVVFAMSKKQAFNLKAHLDICHEMGIPVRVLPGLWDPDDPYLSVDQCQGVPFLVIGATNVNANALFYKKIIDIIGGVAGMIILGILYLPVAAAINLDSPGPVFFRHRRVGQNGRTFCLYKFRTMYEDAEARKAELMAQNEMQGAMFKLKDDPRVTRAGRWLRKTSLDEFPQFINVITGEMSLVGTRPPPRPRRSRNIIRASSDGSLRSRGSPGCGRSRAVTRSPTSRRWSLSIANTSKNGGSWKTSKSLSKPSSWFDPFQTGTTRRFEPPKQRRRT